MLSSEYRYRILLKKTKIIDTND